VIVSVSHGQIWLVVSVGGIAGSLRVWNWEHAGWSLLCLCDCEVARSMLGKGMPCSPYTTLKVTCCARVSCFAWGSSS
jgi:hypothetical protein